MLRTALKFFAALSTLTLSCQLHADEFLYANNAGGHDYVWQLDLTTGAISNQFDIGINANGRGVVDVNSTLYITTASSGTVYSYNIATKSLSTAFTVAGASGLSSITFDGTDFWIGDYSGSNRAYLYSPSGSLLKTITLANCAGYCDGLTYLPANGGEIVSNRADGYDRDSIYDIYSTSGTLTKSSLIDTAGLSTKGCPHTTGIAWDGADFFVSCLDDPTPTLAEYDSSGAFVSIMPLKNPSGFDNGGFGPAMEGLSANFAVTLPTSTPEPGTTALIGVGLAAVSLFGSRVAGRKR
jgi:glutamine cyclotransferase